MKIAFLSNKLTIRGTEVSMFDYADYNEKILGNQSIIITRNYETVKDTMDVTLSAYKKFMNRFPVFFYQNRDNIDEIIKKEKIDILYIQKAGNKCDNLYTTICKCFIHCVFVSNDFHGDIYSPISSFVNQSSKTTYPVLPYMVNVYETDETLHDDLNIPKDAIIFGTYSGENEFTVNYIKKAVINISNNNLYPNIYFIFMNIKPFCNENKNCKFLPGTVDMKFKRKFINTCTAMLYSRDDGETFGLCCGEFSVCDKPIIARNKTEHSAYFSTFHLQTLKDDIIIHENYDQLIDILTNWDKYKKDVSNNGYKQYTAINVMDIFKKLVIES